MATQVRISFIITGVGVNPVDITSYIGVKPTETWHAGDRIQESELKCKYDGWCLSSDREDSLYLDEQVQSILNKIQPHTTKIKQLCNKLNLKIEVACAVYIENNEIPSIHFDEEIVKIIADLRAEIDIDLYIQ